jgi:hypothetical protein
MSSLDSLFNPIVLVILAVLLLFSGVLPGDFDLSSILSGS